MPFVDLSFEHKMHYQIIGDEKARNCLFFVHGIMGKGKNLFSFTKEVIKEYQNTNAVIMDLRNHAESSKHNEPYTIDACAKDLVLLAKHLKISPSIIIGHSFGAKVSLLAAQYLKTPELWLLDAPLSAYESKKIYENEPSVIKVIEIMQEISFPLQARNELVSYLTSKNISLLVASWMSSNLELRQDGFYLNFYLQEIKEMLQSFLKSDLWYVAESIKKNCLIHFVKGENSNRIDQEEIKKIDLYLGDRGFLYELENAGHFLHSDNLLGLVNIIRSNNKWFNMR